MQDILITAKSSIASVGHESEQVWHSYKSEKSALTMCCFGGEDTPVGKLQPESEKKIVDLRREKVSYRRLDKSVLLALWASRQAVKNAGWENLERTAVNMGSSRGATQLFEKYHQHFIDFPKKRISPLVSPTTTLGNIASWVAYDLGSDGATLSHSITCSTALHGVMNACAWLKSDMADKFIVGGAEAPLTDFTIAQMKALGIYSKQDFPWICSPLETGKKSNTMVLGEGASVFTLEKDKGQTHLAKIIGIGCATEIIEHNASLSAEADCMQKSMKAALLDAGISEVDVVVMHAPGTDQGDKSELKAVEAVLGKGVAHIISTKHHTGHTLGASGALSLDLAVEMLNRGEVVSFPYSVDVQQKALKPETVMVNAVGFGGNAVSIVLQKGVTESLS
ncbi:MAG: beta-ketoacyl synthase [Crocinitomicaceae bacterium]|nr:beta-ketoacyl synthase [Crocinitomicaceae bacterium]|tara:strand:- start:3298 stop:4479 length:1182 start_codon:yes stop_codon:yes gene_type:complete